ncbi:Uncharacterized mitochondrial protein AtMg00310 [Linum perenne]
MMNSFWWGMKATGGGGITWMRWERLCMRKEQSGLCFRDLRGFNLAMVFKVKYFPKGSFFTAEEGSNPSLVWKSIWSSQVSTPVIPGFEDLTVAELMIPGFLEWDEEHITSMFNDRDAAIILNTPLPRRGSADRPIWPFGRTGCYTVRSVYRLYMERVVTRMHLTRVNIFYK